MGDRESVRKDLEALKNKLKTRIDYESFFSDEFCFNPQSGSGHVSGKAAEAAVLLDKVKACCLCGLHSSRKNVVFGDGDLDAELVFVGEAPGRDEDLQGKPFVGKAGELLTKIINAMGLERRQVYITNVLRCRPPDNRNPEPEEVSCCKPYLTELLNIIRPKVICTLGKFAAHALLDQTTPISALRGRFFDFNGIKLMPTYHPAYLLRNPEDKKLVWEDMQKIMKALKENEA